METKPRYQRNSYRPNKGGDSQGPAEFDYIQPIQAQPLEVKVYSNFDKALKAFRALVQKERILSNYKEKSRFEKPSDKRRRKQAESIQRLLELAAKEDQEKHPRKRKVPVIEESIYDDE